MSHEETGGVYPDDGCHLRTVWTACHNMQGGEHPQPSTTSLFIACMCATCSAARGIRQHARFMMRVEYCAAYALHAAQHAHSMMRAACCAACALYRALGCRCATSCLRLRGWAREPVVLGANGLPGAQHRLVDMAFCMSTFGQHPFLHVNVPVECQREDLCQLTIFWCCNVICTGRTVGATCGVTFIKEFVSLYSNNIIKCIVL